MTPAPGHPGDELTWDWLNAAREFRSRSGGLRADAGSGLEARTVGRTRTLRRVRADPIWGKLVGSSNPYTFTQEIGLASTLAGPTTGTAYEVNNKTGLGGKVGRLYPDGTGTWRFQHIAKASGTTCGPMTITCFQHCGARAAGAICTLKQGSTTLATGTADASGVCVLTWPGPFDPFGGNFVLTTAYPEHVTRTDTFTGGCAATSRTAQLSIFPFTNIYCCTGLPDQVHYRMPSSLTITLNGTPISLTFATNTEVPREFTGLAPPPNFVAGGSSWVGCSLFPAAGNVASVQSRAVDFNCEPTPGPGNVPIKIFMPFCGGDLWLVYPRLSFNWLGGARFRAGLACSAPWNGVGWWDGTDSSGDADPCHLQYETARFRPSTAGAGGTFGYNPFFGSFNPITLTSSNHLYYLFGSTLNIAITE